MIEGTPPLGDSNGKTLAIGGLIVVIILLLFWARRLSGTTINNVTKYGDVHVDTPRYNDGGISITNPTYVVPGLKNNAVWDWIKACDVACMCGPAVTKARAQPLSFDPLVLPVMVYIDRPTSPALPSFAGMPPAPTFDFPAWTAPALPEFWYEAGYNVHHEDGKFIMTADGKVGILGKYSRSGWPTNASYPLQTKDVTVAGDFAFIDGIKYKYNPAKNVTTRAPRPVNNDMAFGR